jgi:hypothetical protein
MDTSNRPRYVCFHCGKAQPLDDILAMLQVGFALCQVFCWFCGRRAVRDTRG